MSWNLPDGYERVDLPGPVRVSIVVRRRAREALLRVGLDDPERASAGPVVVDWVGGGRSRHPVIAVEGERWVLKSYRRGGMMQLINRDRYFRVDRFLRELRTSHAGERAGVPFAETIAFIFRGAGTWGAWRAWHVLRFEPSVVSLGSCLLAGGGADPECSPGGSPAPGSLSTADRCAVFRAAGVAVRRLHQARIDHPDLNVGNVLFRLAPRGAGEEPPRGSDNPVEVFIIDLDKARERPGLRWIPHRNLLRFWRSFLKLDQTGRAPRGVIQSSLLAFLRGYFGRDRAALRAFRDYRRRFRAVILFHVALWRLGALRRGKVLQREAVG